MSIKRVLTRAFSPLKTLWHTTGSCYDPVCQRPMREFRPHGKPARPNARCPLCGSLERDRLAWLVLRDHTFLLDGRRRRLLHFAPERAVEDALRSRGNFDYVSADLKPGRAMLQADITNLQLPENSFDAVYCSHVLEHVPDDRRAMRELYRVLAPGGVALIQVPERGDRTYEDSSITYPSARAAAFGQHDHVRWYGTDVGRRLELAGFQIRRYSVDDGAVGLDRSKSGLADDDAAGIVTLCFKAPNANPVQARSDGH